MNLLPRWRAWLADRPPLPLRRGMLIAAAVLVLLSLGAPWRRGAGSEVGRTTYTPMFQVVTPMVFEGGAVTSSWNPSALVPDWSMSGLTIMPGFGSRKMGGTAHPARVPIVASGVLGVAAVRRRSRRLMAAALTVAAAGLVLTSAGSLMSPGWILFATATAVAALAVGLASSVARLVSAPAGRRR